MAGDLEQLGERNYPATPLQLERARRRGQVPRSSELTASVTMLAGAAALALLGPAMLQALTGMVAAMLDGGPGPGTEMHAISGLLANSAGTLLWTVLPVMAAVVVVAVLCGLVQVGPMAASEQLACDWSRVSVAAGLRRLWSVRTLERLALVLARAAAVGLVAWWTIASAMPRIAAAGGLNTKAMLAEAGSLVWQLSLRAGLALVALGVLDYLYQRWQHTRDLRMSYRELRDDLKQMESTRKRESGFGNRVSLAHAEPQIPIPETRPANV